MTGHVFHPGHDEWHGVTVIVRGLSGRTYLGRWHERAPRGITMRDVAIHDPGSNSTSLDDWLAKQRRFGVSVAERMIVIPSNEAIDVSVFEPI